MLIITEHYCLQCVPSPGSWQGTRRSWMFQMSIFQKRPRHHAGVHTAKYVCESQLEDKHIFQSICHLFADLYIFTLGDNWPNIRCWSGLWTIKLCPFTVSQETGQSYCWWGGQLVKTTGTGGLMPWRSMIQRYNSVQDKYSCELKGKKDCYMIWRCRPLAHVPKQKWSSDACSLIQHCLFYFLNLI